MLNLTLLKIAHNAPTSHQDSRQTEPRVQTQMQRHPPPREDHPRSIPTGYTSPGSLGVRCWRKARSRDGSRNCDRSERCPCSPFHGCSVPIAPPPWETACLIGLKSKWVIQEESRQNPSGQTRPYSQLSGPRQLAFTWQRQCAHCEWGGAPAEEGPPGLCVAPQQSPPQHFIGRSAL